MLEVNLGGLVTGKQEVWVKEKVKVVAVCPAIVNTYLIQSYLCSMGDTERTKIEPVEVALVVEQAIVSGETGDVV